MVHRQICQARYQKLRSASNSEEGSRHGASSMRHSVLLVATFAVTHACPPSRSTCKVKPWPSQARHSSFQRTPWVPASALQFHPSRRTPAVAPAQRTIEVPALPVSAPGSRQQILSSSQGTKTLQQSLALLLTSGRAHISSRQVSGPSPSSGLQQISTYPRKCLLISGRFSICTQMVR